MIEPKKILVAEDDENDAELILKALEKYNIANGVIIVEDGAEALDYLYRRGDYETRADGNPSWCCSTSRCPEWMAWKFFERSGPTRG